MVRAFKALLEQCAPVRQAHRVTVLSGRLMRRAISSKGPEDEERGANKCEDEQEGRPWAAVDGRAPAEKELDSSAPTGKGMDPSDEGAWLKPGEVGGPKVDDAGMSARGGTPPLSHGRHVRESAACGLGPGRVWRLIRGSYVFRPQSSAPWWWTRLRARCCVTRTASTHRPCDRDRV
jgi:hypothetical protein